MIYFNNFINKLLNLYNCQLQSGLLIKSILRHQYLVIQSDSQVLQQFPSHKGESKNVFIVLLRSRIKAGKLNVAQEAVWCTRN